MTKIGQDSPGDKSLGLLKRKFSKVLVERENSHTEFTSLLFFFFSQAAREDAYVHAQRRGIMQLYKKYKHLHNTTEGRPKKKKKSCGEKTRYR